MQESWLGIIIMYIEIKFVFSAAVSNAHAASLNTPENHLTLYSCKHNYRGLFEHGT